MPGRLAGKVALITGATSGIGKATALLFAEEGAALVLTGRRKELGRGIEQAVSALSAQALYVQADHTRPDDCRRTVDQAISRFGRIDVLFNNAG
ncbi:MAG TPA: SDR family NAD(P)-dependent oxidoreductase, partial [Anaerolineales bacterium]|nr:SDR family NAD(P)-dependent oxidoreductase [Anaerolineales bacterium]